MAMNMLKIITTHFKSNVKKKKRKTKLKNQMMEWFEMNNAIVWVGIHLNRNWEICWYNIFNVEALGENTWRERMISAENLIWNTHDNNEHSYLAIEHSTYMYFCDVHFD